MNTMILTQNKRQTIYKERLLAQKIQLLEMALKTNLSHPSLRSADDVAKARFNLFNFMRGCGDE